MTDEQYETLAGYLDIIARQLEFLCQTAYLTATAQDETAPSWSEIADQEIYYNLQEPGENK